MQRVNYSRKQDIEFASIMVQNLNNNLITAPELSDMRKRLRNLESKVVVIVVRSALNHLTSLGTVHCTLQILVSQCGLDILPVSPRSML